MQVSLAAAASVPTGCHGSTMPALEASRGSPNGVERFSLAVFKKRLIVDHCLFLLERS